MAVQCQPFTCFHTIHGTNVRIDSSGTQATRVESFANGICFSREPLVPGQLFLVEIEEKELGWCGNLRVGLMARDPRSLEILPEYSLPDLVNQGESWIFAITRNHNRVIPDGEENISTLGKHLSEPYLKVGKIKIPRDKLIARSKPGRYSHILDELYKTNILPPTARRSRIGVLYETQADGTCHMHIIINGEDMGVCARGIPTNQPLYAVVDVFASTKSVRVIQLEYGCMYYIWGMGGIASDFNVFYSALFALRKFRSRNNVPLEERTCSFFLRNTRAEVH
ncbi:neuralized-like protein 2 [Hyla sarda]|uniref:neuralized-like protein 2 n=1 Tax=Hyla sarda TaxID=327740 RepID=UPI0024C32844|nr:neuralized-like protein 2 [Hyla sarda]